MAHPVLSRYFMAHSGLFSTNLNATAYLLLPSLNGCFQLHNVAKLKLSQCVFLNTYESEFIALQKPSNRERLHDVVEWVLSKISEESNFSVCQAHTRQFWKQKGAKRASVYPTSVRKLLAYMTYKKADSLNQSITNKKQCTDYIWKVKFKIFSWNIYIRIFST